MYYNPRNNRVFFFFTANSWFGFEVRPNSKFGKSFESEFINTELRKKWESDQHVIRLASDNLAGWNE